MRPAPAALMLALSGLACTDSQLECVGGACQPAAALARANVLRAVGEVCTTDAASASYPTKVVFVIDTSGSTRKSDPVNGRQRAVVEAVDAFAANPEVFFALVTFSSSPVLVQPTFTRDHNLLMTAAASAALAGGATDYLATLQAVQTLITQDVAQSPPAQRLYTQYSVQWLSDGNPEVDPQVPAAGLPASDPSLLQHCSQTLPLVSAAVDALVALPARLGFFSLTLSSIYLTGAFDSPCDVLIPLDPNAYGHGDDFLRAMAKAGGGSFQEVSADNLHFDITVNTVSRRFVARGFSLANLSRVVAGPSLLPDSDRDGLDDAREAALGTNPLAMRAVPGGCSDLIAQRSVEDPIQCRRGCPGAAPGADADADALFDCEETVLATDANLADTDADGLLDPDEVRLGLDPRAPTLSNIDSDQDGVADRQELTAGTDPFAGGDQAHAFAYSRFDPLPTDAPAGTTCYAFEVDNVELVETLATSTSQAGDNTICLTLLEEPADDPGQQPSVRRACKVANYRRRDGVDLMTPADGTLRFVADDFAAVICDGAPCAVADPNLTIGR